MLLSRKMWVGVGTMDYISWEGQLEFSILFSRVLVFYRIAINLEPLTNPTRPECSDWLQHKQSNASEGLLLRQEPSNNTHLRGQWSSFPTPF
jgi:hypothetical protein